MSMFYVDNLQRYNDFILKIMGKKRESVFSTTFHFLPWPPFSFATFFLLTPGNLGSVIRCIFCQDYLFRPAIIKHDCPSYFFLNFYNDAAFKYF